MPADPLSANQREAVARLTAVFIGDVPYNPFRGHMARTFFVRLCLPQAVKVHTAAVRLDPCSYCGAPGGHLDRLTPHAAGAPPARPRARAAWRDARADAITGACRQCSLDKSHADVLQFMLERVDPAYHAPGSRRK